MGNNAKYANAKAGMPIVIEVHTPKRLKGKPVIEDTFMQDELLKKLSIANIILGPRIIITYDAHQKAKNDFENATGTSPDNELAGLVNEYIAIQNMAGKSIQISKNNRTIVFVLLIRRVEISDSSEPSWIVSVILPHS